MALEHKKRYEGTVISAGITQSKSGESPVIFVKVQCEAGSCDWEKVVTVLTAPHIEETFSKCFGVTRAQLATKGFIEQFMAGIGGIPISFSTKLEQITPESKPFMIAEYLNPVGRYRPPATDATKDKIADIFGGRAQHAASKPVDPSQGWPDDKDSPF